MIPTRPMWTCARVVRIIATGRCEMVMPIGTKAARDTDRYIRAVPRTHTRPIRGLWLGEKGPTHTERHLPDDQGPG